MNSNHESLFIFIEAEDMCPWACPPPSPHRLHSHLAHSCHCYRQVYPEFYLWNHPTLECFLRIGLLGISDEQLAAAPFTGWRLYIRHVRLLFDFIIIAILSFSTGHLCYP